MKLTSITLYLFSPFLLLAGYRGIINTLRMRFSAEYAVEMGKRSAALRKQREADRLANPPTPVEPPPPNDQAASNEYTLRRLARTRTQIDLLSTRLEQELAGKECDAMLIDRIASAIARLSIIERELSGRPLPGTLRPAAPSKAQRTTQGPSLPPAT